MFSLLATFDQVVNPPYPSRYFGLVGEYETRWGAVWEYAIMFLFFAAFIIAALAKIKSNPTLATIFLIIPLNLMFLGLFTYDFVDNFILGNFNDWGNPLWADIYQSPQVYFSVMAPMLIVLWTFNIGGCFFMTRNIKKALISLLFLL